MAHNDWCGKACGECDSPCALDRNISCSPDCGGLNEDGTRNAGLCTESGCDAFATTEGECPICGNGDLTYGSSYLEDESYIYEWSCKKCGASGKELYSLTFVAHSLD